jgi:prokaryotic ubiquitin-like protein Pup
MVREHIERKRSHRRKDDAVDEHRPARSDRTESTLADDIDDILEEIDAVLEENAEEFVKSYVQKGGE